MTFLSRFFRGRLLSMALVLAVFFGLLSPAPHAADLGTLQLNRALGRTVTRYATTDGSIALRLKWVGGTIGSASVAVEADGNLTFLNAAGTADVTVVASTGVIDVSGATMDTFGEVCDIINASDNWECVLVDVLPSTTANNVLTAFTASATGLTDDEGLAIKYNTADLDMISLSIGPEYTTDAEVGLTSLLNRKSYADGTSPIGTYSNELLYVTTQATYTTGAPDLKVYTVKETVGHSAGATEVLLWQDVGAATTVAKTIPVLPKQAPIKAPPGWRIVIQYVDASTPDVTAGSMQIHGLSYRQTP